MKSTTWLLAFLVLLLLIAFASALLRWAVLRTGDYEGLALNLGTEIIGAVLTYLLFELLIGRRQRREAEKADLIAQMGSQVPDVAIAAAEELRRHGWLTDGSLQGAYLLGANLQGAILHRAELQGAFLAVANLQGASLAGANLQRAHLRGANLQGAILHRAELQGANLGLANLQGANLGMAKLQGADLYRAELQGAYLSGAKLQGAYLRDANLQGADLTVANLQDAKFNEATILPDGTKWTDGTVMDRFTDPNHPDFWHPEE
ncbi:MAG: pentapeptide repeat-containing protein [Anaerolineae bacterium]